MQNRAAALLVVVGLSQGRIVICGSHFCNRHKHPLASLLEDIAQKCLATSPGSCWGAFLGRILCMCMCPNTRTRDTWLEGVTGQFWKCRLPLVETCLLLEYYCLLWMDGRMHVQVVSVGGFGSLCTLALLSFLWDPLTVSETIIPTPCISLPIFLSS